jgi:hypothetical protein
LSFAPLNARRTCDFGLIVLVIFIVFHINLVAWHSCAIFGAQVSRRYPAFGHTEEPSFHRGVPAPPAKVCRVRNASALPRVPMDDATPPRPMQPVCSSSRANSRGCKRLRVYRKLATSADRRTNPSATYIGLGLSRRPSSTSLATTLELRPAMPAKPGGSGPTGAKDIKIRHHDDDQQCL